MCGLYASIAFAPERARIDRVAHRGPDGSGWREFASAAGPVALGHRRLAIIDLSEAGLQPMADASGRYHLVFNGEIYNYLELRDELRAKGHQFSSDTDSEVLLAAYREWGEGCLQRFLGMFAFLIWDERDQILFAARDRFGIKPLYVAVNQRGIAFASEIKQLLGLPGLTRTDEPCPRPRFPRRRDERPHRRKRCSRASSSSSPAAASRSRPGGPGRGGSSRSAGTRSRPHGTLRLSEAEAAEQFRSLLTEFGAPASALGRAGRVLPLGRARFLLDRLPHEPDARCRGARRPGQHGLGLLRRESASTRRRSWTRWWRTRAPRRISCFQAPEDVFARASDHHLAPGRAFRLDLDLRAVVRVRGSAPRRDQGDARRPGRRRGSSPAITGPMPGTS